MAAAVILSPDAPIRGLNDSKLLEPERREVLAVRIRQRAISWAIVEIDSEIIDRINILQASRLAMKRAIEQLTPLPDYVLVDAVALDVAMPQQPLIQGDARCHAIAAASIIAKVHRDARCQEFDLLYPGYGFASHKGYHTPEHLAALDHLGPTPLHRFTFEPIRSMTRFTPLSREPQLEMFAAV